MWNLRQFLGGAKQEERSKVNSNATLIDNQHLLDLFGQSADKLIIFDLRRKDELERFPFTIPGALLTLRANILHLVDWIPPQAIVVLYGAEKISAYSSVIANLPQDAHFYLLEGGVKSWRQARLPMEPAEEFIPSEVPAIWTHDPARKVDAKNGHT